MIENQAKGWHGSYSAIGRISAEKFPMILIKDQIINGKYKKQKIKDYFSTEEELPDNKIYIDEDDIFTHPTVQIRLKKKIKAICKPDTKSEIPEEYKYHHLHHKELNHYNQLMKFQKNFSLGSTIYDPKKDFVWNRTITGPQWNVLAGREKNKLSHTKNNFSGGPDFYDPQNNLIGSDNKVFIMNKQTQRGIIPVFYDLRIRTDKPFNKENINNSVDNKNNNKNKNIINSKIILKNKKSSKNHLSMTTYNSSKKTVLKISTKNFGNFQNNFSEKKEKDKIHTINFAKSLSRHDYNYLHRSRETTRPFFNPKYNLVEPKCITMVSYNKIKKGKSLPKRIKGLDVNLFFDPDKIINKVNNHKEVCSPNFKYMTSKNSEKGFLPSYMKNVYSRGTLDLITEKGLKMNKYSEVGSKSDYGTFCNKKSFNKVINYELLKNNKDLSNKLQMLSRKFGSKNNITSLMQFYLLNLDDDKNKFTGKKFDAITLKSIDSPDLLSKSEKELFSLNFSS